MTKKKVKGKAVAKRSPPVAAPPEAAAVPARNEKGQFQNLPGPGRPKGSKNLITQYRTHLESALRAYMADEKQIGKAIAAIDRMFTIMTESDDEKVAVMAFKAMSDKMIASPKQEETDSNANRVTVIIDNRLEGEQARPVDVVIDSTATEVT